MIENIFIVLFHKTRDTKSKLRYFLCYNIIMIIIEMIIRVSQQKNIPYDVASVWKSTYVYLFYPL